MRTYLVGGAVRDIVLGRKPKDYDYVVVGGTEQEMLDKGFVRVGAQFPTFLHPTTKDEYALARTEKSCGLKHTDFTVDFNPEVTNLNPQLVKSFQDLGYHLDVHRAMELNHKTLVDKLEALGALRDPESFRAVLLSAEADSKGRLGYEDREYPQYEYMMKASMALKALKYSDLAEQYQGKRLLDAIRARKTNAMKAFKKQWNNGRD